MSQSLNEDQDALAQPEQPEELELPRSAGTGDEMPGASAQPRTIRKLGLLLPGIVRVLELRRVQGTPPLWRVTLADAPEVTAGVLGEAGLDARAHSLRAFLTFETDDLGLLQQLRPRRLRLAVDLLELQRGGAESGLHDLP